MAAQENSFDFRIAVRERERAMRLLEAMVTRSGRSGEDIDRELLERLLATVSGHRPRAAL